jgi:photosystem II stability/assembly factor-like uncharacterized protein
VNVSEITNAKRHQCKEANVKPGKKLMFVIMPILLTILSIGFFFGQAGRNSIRIDYTRTTVDHRLVSWDEGSCIDAQNCWIGLNRTKDGGITWEKAVLSRKILEVFNLDAQRYKDEKYLELIEATAIQTIFADKEHGWLIVSSNRGNSFWETFDGGTNWQEVSTDKVFPITRESVVFLNNEEGVLWRPDSVSSNKQIFFKTKNGGMDWEPCGAIPSNISFHCLPFFDNFGTGWVISSLKNEKDQWLLAILKSKDKGCSWNSVWESPLTPKNKDFGIGGEIYSLDGQNIYIAAGYDGCLSYSKDGGSSWTNLVFPVEKGLIGVFFKNLQEGFVLTLEGKMWRTKDAGKSWALLNKEEILAMSFCDKQKVRWQKGRIFQMVLAGMQ